MKNIDMYNPLITLADKQYIIIDGASSDKTLEIISNYSDKINVITSEPDEGVYYAMNKGLSQARGEIIGFLHSDDIYENNNVLNSLIYAEEAICGHVICAYSDILFDANVVQLAIESRHDISVVVDVDWRPYYDGRSDHPLEEAENIIFDTHNKVISAGKIMAAETDMHGEFIGMIKFSPRGAKLFRRHFHRAKKLYMGKPFQRSKVFKEAYLTDLIQEMVNIGVPIHCVIIERGWKEIDTIEDYEKALKAFDD